MKIGKAFDKLLQNFKLEMKVTEPSSWVSYGTALAREGHTISRRLGKPGQTVMLNACEMNVSKGNHNAGPFSDTVNLQVKDWRRQ